MTRTTTLARLAVDRLLGNHSARTANCYSVRGIASLISRPQSIKRLCSATPANVRKINTLKTRKAFNYSLSEHNNLEVPVKAVSLEGANVELKDIDLIIDGQLLSFNLTWLRDSCHCSECTHQHSRQRLFTPKDFRKHLYGVMDVKLCRDKGDNPDRLIPNGNGSAKDDVLLAVTWANGHESLYSVEWLRQIYSLYSKSHFFHRATQLGTRQSFSFPDDDFYGVYESLKPPSATWNVAEIRSRLEPVDYHSLVDGFKFNDEATFINANRIFDMSPARLEAMRLVSKQLVTYGLAKIVNVPSERNQVLKVAKSLAYERPTGYGVVFDVVVEPSDEINLAYSSLEFDLHSDLTYRETSPGVQLLHCIRNSTEGGLSYFSDAHKAAEMLKVSDPILFEVLVKFPVTFVVRDPYRNIKFRHHKPVITLNSDDSLGDIYYSPFMLPPVGYKNDVKLFYLAMDKFTKHLQAKENKLIEMMEPGDLFMFHNRRVLHGRSAYNATTSSRFLQGCYMDWDEIECLHEKLHSC